MTVGMNWREDAACSDSDPDLFFPIGTTGNTLRQIEAAKRICLTCPAQLQCPGLGAGKRDHRWRVGRHHGGRTARHPGPFQKKGNQ
jgi:hypothetical protein